MKPKPVKQTSAVEYPSFRKFHITRQALIAGATVAALSGCVTKTSGVPVPPEVPEATLSQNQSGSKDQPIVVGGIPPQTSQPDMVFPLIDRDRDNTDLFDVK